MTKVSEIVMSQRKQSNKEYVEKRLHAREREVKGGDAVLLETRKENKLSTACEREPFTVMSRYGDLVIL